MSTSTFFFLVVKKLTNIKSKFSISIESVQTVLINQFWILKSHTQMPHDNIPMKIQQYRLDKLILKISQLTTYTAKLNLRIPFRFPHSWPFRSMYSYVCMIRMIRWMVHTMICQYYLAHSSVCCTGPVFVTLPGVHADRSGRWYRIVILVQRCYLSKKSYIVILEHNTYW